MIKYPSQSELKRLFEYSSDYGLLIWKKRQEMSGQWNGKFAGKPAGNLNHSASKNGYSIRVKINDIKYELGRLVWIWHFGDVPENKIICYKDRLSTRVEDLSLSDKSMIQTGIPKKTKQNEVLF